MNGEKNSTTSANFAHKSFIEFELSQRNNAKKTWLADQDYDSEDSPSGIDGANRRGEDVTERKRIVAASSEFCLFGKIACDFLSCDKHLISGVTIRLTLGRSYFVTMSEQPNKHYQIQITEANLYVRKLRVTDFVLTTIEKTQLKTLAIDNFIEMLPRTFLAPTGVQTWQQQDILFMKETKY